MFNQPVNNYVPGTGYTNYMPNAKMTQPLTKEDMNLLRQNSASFSLAITPQDRARGICTHKENGHFTLVENPNGTVRCTICGKVFSLLDIPVEEAMNITQRFTDLLQSIKTLYYDMPEQTASEFFQIMPLLEKVPQLYEIAIKNASEHDNPQMYNQNNAPYGFNAFNNMLGGIGGMNPYAPQQPMMNQYGQAMNNQYAQPQQPMMNQYGQAMNNPYAQPQQPMMNQYGQAMNNPYAQPQASQGNPFYGGQPQSQPQQPQVPQQPQAPQNIQPENVKGQEIQQTKTFNV